MINKKGKVKAWSLADYETLAQLYPTTENSELSEMFGRTVTSIKHAARNCGVKKCPVWMHNERVRIGTENGKLSAWKENQVCNARAMKPGRTLTGSGFQDVVMVPGGRIIRHCISDVKRKAT